MTLAADAAGNIYIYIGTNNDTRVWMMSASIGVINTVVGANSVPEGISAKLRH